MANSVDQDETAHYEPSHLDLHSLQKCLSCSTGLKGLIICALVILVSLVIFFKPVMFPI